jgi:hypothetical protein
MNIRLHNTYYRSRPIFFSMKKVLSMFIENGKTPENVGLMKALHSGVVGGNFTGGNFTGGNIVGGKCRRPLTKLGKCGIMMI